MFRHVAGTFPIYNPTKTPLNDEVSAVQITVRKVGTMIFPKILFADYFCRRAVERTQQVILELRLGLELPSKSVGRR